MAGTTYFDDELIRFRERWLLAVRGGDAQAARDASTAYFTRAEQLAATVDHRDHIVHQASAALARVHL